MTPIVTDSLEILRQVNANLLSARLGLRPEQKHCSAIRPQDFSDLRSDILRAAESLRRSPVSPETTAALEKELLEYRGNLEKLKDFLPELHAHLLAEKSRLETAQTHVAAAVAWVQANQQTL